MTHETLPKDALLLAEDMSGCFANAFILRALIVTANHVANGRPIFQVPFTEQLTNITLEEVRSRDIALSVVKTIAQGFESVAPPELNQYLTIVGFHGFQHLPFEIVVRVIEILPDGRTIVERISGTEAQVGMSGSPAVTAQNEVVGILVSGVEGTDGKQLYLESIIDLQFQDT